MRPALCAALAVLFACDGSKHATVVDGAISDRGDSNLGNDTGETGGVDIDAGPPQLTVSPSRIFLQATTTDGRWPLGTVVLKNPGESPTGPLVMSFAGPNREAFELHRQNCPGGLSPSGACAVFVLFHAPDVLPQPEVGSEAHATLTIADSEASGLAGTVDITAVTVVPSEGLAIIGPPDMGVVRLGTTGDSLPFIVVNTGTSDAGTLRTSISSPQFVITLDLCSGYSLASVGTCSFAVQFAPATPAFQWAVLTVQGSAEHMLASEIVTGSGIAQ
jgi:hypothetical protein